MIEFRNVSMSYKTGIQALKDVSFKVQDGEFVFIIGLSGSGKSTLVKLLTCEENPSKGNVFIDDYDISFLKRSLIPYLRRNIGMVFQDFRLIYSKTVYENVAFAMEIIGASPKLIKHRVPIVLSIVGLRDKAFVKANELSGGEQQRVVIARAMVNNPMLILADEPTGNLDPVNSELIMALLEEINYNGTTVIVCTHESNIVNRMRRRVIEISDGSLVRDEMLGEYNLATSSENQKKRSKNSKRHSHADSPATDKKETSHGVPFVRNINIKFGEVERTEDLDINTEELDINTEELDISTDDLEISTEDTDAEADLVDLDMSKINIIDNGPDIRLPLKGIRETAKPEEPAIEQKKTLPSASDYYQKWVQDYKKQNLDKGGSTPKAYVKEKYGSLNKETGKKSLHQEIADEIASKDDKIKTEEKTSVEATDKLDSQDSQKDETGKIDFQVLIKAQRIEKSASMEDLK